MQELFEGGFTDLCLEYPMWARILAQRAQNWITYISEFLHALSRDRESLVEQFGINSSHEQVNKVEPLADDTHQGGRVPLKIGFKDGTSVVFKPRSTKISEAFYEGLASVDDYLSTPDLYIPNYLSRDEYGWMEYISFNECSNSNEVEDYYRRTGVILFWSYFTETTDLQEENFVAHGEYPVVLDAETFMHPWIPPEQRPSMAWNLEGIEKSPLHTALVPWGVEEFELTEDVKPYAYSGIGESSEPVKISNAQFPVVEANNTDLMSVNMQPVWLTDRDNVPQQNGSDCRPADYVDEIVEGFENAYDAILNLRESEGDLGDILETDSVRDLPGRVIFRPTSAYEQTLLSLKSREALIDGAYFTVAMEEMISPFFDGQTTNMNLCKAYKYEREALKRLEPPRFIRDIDDTRIRFGERDTGVDADMSGSEFVCERLKSLSKSDRDKHSTVLRECFERFPGSSSQPQRSSSLSANSDSSVEETAVATATQLYEETIDRGTPVVDSNEDVLHEYASIIPNHGGAGLSLRFSSESIYAGHLGIAIVAGALYEVTDDEKYQKDALGFVKPIIRQISKGEVNYGCGGLNGTGSVIYGLTLLSEFLPNVDFETQVSEIASRFSTQKVLQDCPYNLTNGVAGLMLSTLACHNRFTSESFAKVATKCGNYLLDSRVETSAGYLGWSENTEQSHLGYAFGSSGIAYALGRLGDVTKNCKFTAAARETLAYESELFSEAEKQTDVGLQGDSMYSNGLCHGQTGVTLSRLGLARHIDDPKFKKELTQMLSQLHDTELLDYDHICCGNFGRVSTLIEGSKEGFVDSSAAFSYTNKILNNIDNPSDFATVGSGIPMTNTGFAVGTAGIIYTLLRISNPDLPCIFLFN